MKPYLNNYLKEAKLLKAYTRPSCAILDLNRQTSLPKITETTDLGSTLNLKTGATGKQGEPSIAPEVL